jgi:hypothetical protein
MSTQVVVARVAGLTGAELLDEPATFLVVETWASPVSER